MTVADTIQINVGPDILLAMDEQLTNSLGSAQ